MFNSTYTFKFVVKTSDNSDSIRFIVRFAGSCHFDNLSEYAAYLTPRQKARLRSFLVRNCHKQLCFYTLWSRPDCTLDWTPN